MIPTVLYYDGVYTIVDGRADLLSKRYPSALIFGADRLDSETTDDLIHMVLYDSTKVRYETFDALYYNKTKNKESSENEQQR